MMRPNDSELTAMEELKAILEKLDPQQCKRVLDWARSRFAYGGGTEDTDAIPPDHKDFADIFNAANPKTNAERALIGGYWFQVVNKQKMFSGQQVNGILKELGQEVKNITDAFSSLKSEKPSLALQVKKAGRTRQARKQYKLTTEGMKRVERMISGHRGDAAS